MAEDNVNVNDQIEMKTETVESGPPRNPYIVVSDVGLFKNNKQYEKGSQVMLDDRTAKAFLEAGDIQAIEEAKTNE